MTTGEPEVKGADPLKVMQTRNADAHDVIVLFFPLSICSATFTQAGSDRIQSVEDRGNESRDAFHRRAEPDERVGLTLRAQG